MNKASIASSGDQYPAPPFAGTTVGGSGNVFGTTWYYGGYASQVEVDALRMRVVALEAAIATLSAALTVAAVKPKGRKQ